MPGRSGDAANGHHLPCGLGECGKGQPASVWHMSSDVPSSSPRVVVPVAETVTTVCPEVTSNSPDGESATPKGTPMCPSATIEEVGLVQLLQGERQPDGERADPVGGFGDVGLDEQEVVASLVRDAGARGARPGLGTFVVASLPGADRVVNARFLASISGWLVSARSAGLGPDGVALPCMSSP